MGPSIGTTIAGRYQLLDQLGQGGMGTVYRALQTNLGREVALKIVEPPHQRNGERSGRMSSAVVRFEREARTIAKLNHPGIVTIHDFGALEANDGVEGGLFIVMELLDGMTLGQAIAAGPMPYPRTLLIMRDVATALAAAHSHGIVHRDLKPDNIMVVGRGRTEVAKVLDFGIAKLAGGEERDATITEAGIVVGTPAYMAPEVIMGGAVDARADLFSLGLVWMELLTGQRVFAATQPSAAMVQAASQPIPSPADAGLQLPTSVSRAIMRLLSRDLAQRTASAQALVDELEACIRETASGAFDGQDARFAAVSAAQAVRATLDNPQVADGVPRNPGPGAGAARPAPSTLRLGSISETNAGASRPAVSPSASTLVTPSSGHAPASMTVQGGGFRKALIAAFVGTAAVGALAIGVLRPSSSPPEPAPPVPAVALTSPPPSNEPTSPPAAAIATHTATAPAIVDTPAPAVDDTVAAATADEIEIADEKGADATTEAAPANTSKSPKASRFKTKASTTRPSTKSGSTSLVASAQSTSSTKEAPAGPPALTSDLIEAGIQQLLGKAGACRNTNITNARKGGGLLIDHCPSYKTVEESQQLYVTIKPDGSVQRVRFRDAGLAAKSPIAACVADSIMAWRFPAFQGDEAVEIGQRLTFKPCVPINNRCVFQR